MLHVFPGAGLEGVSMQGLDSCHGSFGGGFVGNQAYQGQAPVERNQEVIRGFRRLGPFATHSDHLVQPVVLRTLPLWLNAGVPATKFAEWAGHSVAVLLRVYAKCIAGQEDSAQQRVDVALNSSTNSPDARR